MQFSTLHSRAWLHTFCLLCIIWALLCSSAQAQEHILERAYWTDSQNLTDIAQVEQQVFKPYTGVLSRGYTQDITWVRLKIKASSGSEHADKLILRMRPVYLDELLLYDRLDTSGRIRRTGDTSNYQDAEYDSLSHTFVIPTGSTERYIYLRLRATSTTLLYVEAFTPDEMLKAEHRLLVGYFAVLALITVFLTLVFFNWLNFKEYLYAVFAIRHLVYLIFTAAFFGFARFLLSDWVTASVLDSLYNWLVIGTTAFSIWFEYMFLSEYQPPEWAKRCMQAMLLCSFVIASLLLTGLTNKALQLNMMLNGLAVLSFFLLAVLFIQSKPVPVHNPGALFPKKVVVGYYLFLNILLWANVLPALGLLAGDEFALNGLISYSLCSGIVMTVLMQRRANLLKQNVLQYKQDLLLSNQQIELEKIKREEQSQLLTMLMHELKNPLAVIDLAQHADDNIQSKNYVTKNVAIIKDILDRCLNADRISNGKLIILREPVDLRNLIEDVLADLIDDSNRLRWHKPETTAIVSTDAQCVRIVLNNLLANAMKYGDQDQPIDIQMSTSADHPASVRIDISNKPGVAGWPESDKLFKKYYRSNGAKSISGTGLGLYLVDSIVKVLGIQCSYKPDSKNIRFELCFPL